MTNFQFRFIVPTNHRKGKEMIDDGFFFSIDEDGLVTIRHDDSEQIRELRETVEQRQLEFYFNTNNRLGFSRSKFESESNLVRKLLLYCIADLAQNESEICIEQTLLKASAIVWNGFEYQILDNLLGSWKNDEFVIHDEQSDHYRKFEIDRINFAKVGVNGYYGRMLSFTRSGGSLLRFSAGEIAKVMKTKAEAMLKDANLLRSSYLQPSMRDAKFKLTVCSRLQPSDKLAFNFRVIIHDEQLSAASLCAERFASECSHPSKETYSISYSQADKLIKEVGAEWQVHDSLSFSSFTANREFLINWKRKN